MAEELRTTVEVGRVRRLIFTLAPPMGVFAILAITACAYASVRFRSPGTAVRYLRGERLLIEADNVELGDVQSGAEANVPVRVANYSGAPVKVVGVWVSCSCLHANDYPLTVAPGERRTLPVVFRAPKSRQGALE